jgi:3-deoxy-D-manno-octulosonic-acid transferase
VFRAVYILATFCLAVLVNGLSPFIPKLKHFKRLRKEGQKPKAGQVKYWIHAASLGEYEMAVPLIERLLEKNALDEIIITLFSPSGYTQAIKGKYAERLMYLPLDTLGNVQEFYRDYAPQKALFIRYDFWYTFIYEGQKRGTQFYLVNGRFQANHFFFKWYGKSYLTLLRKFEGIYTSDRASETLLNKWGVRAEFLGDTRFDRVSDITKRAKPYADIKKFIGDRKVLIVGSSWEPEEELVANLLAEKLQNLAIIIAPHDLRRSTSIATNLAPFSPKLYTDGSFSEKDQVLILDTMGMLSSMYQYADFALIGGGFSGALHNILEPAVWGCHLSYGPHTSKFPEAQEFVEAGFAHSIVDQNQWIATIRELSSDNLRLEILKTKAQNYTSANMGATSRIISSIAH